MTALDSRPELAFEVVLKNVAGSGVTVLAAVAFEDNARAIARLLEKSYGRGVVSVREAVAS